MKQIPVGAALLPQAPATYSFSAYSQSGERLKIYQQNEFLNTSQISYNEYYCMSLLNETQKITHYIQLTHLV